MIAFLRSYLMCSSNTHPTAHSCLWNFAAPGTLKILYGHSSCSFSGATLLQFINWYKPARQKVSLTILTLWLSFSISKYQLWMKLKLKEVNLHFQEILS
jgi:hypothetical protein